MNDIHPIVSIVVPTRNEEANVERMASVIIDQMEIVGESFEIIFIDNASDDRTVSIIRDLCASDSRIKLIVNARNFGQMRSPTHGIFQARGKAIISLCADFQDPPELIPAFIERWRAGKDIVLGVREAEKSSVALGTIRGLSYWFAEHFGDYPIIPNATGFGLYDQKVVRAIAQLNEPEPFFRGMLVETGSVIDTISYSRPQRSAGKSNNNFFALLDFMLSSVAGASKKLVRVPFYIGTVSLLLSVALIPLALIATFMGFSAAPYLWLCVIELNFGMLFMFMGVIGDQIRLISERTRQTPLVVERERINFSDTY